jgi:phosphoglycolate phosphatase
MRYPAVLFDLDGTLLDTIGDICDAFNHVLRANGFPTRAVDEYKAIVGHGARDAARQVLPSDRRDDALIQKLFEEYQAVYPRYNGKKTRPFPGVMALITMFAEKGIKLAVVSNKPHAAAERCIKEYFPGIPFAAVRGHVEGVPLKPDPTVALAIARELDLPPHAIAFVGDSDVDIRTAIAAGMRPIGVTWGYRSESQIRSAGECLVVDSTTELTRLLADQTEQSIR